MPASDRAARSYQQGARALEAGRLEQAERALWSCLAEDARHAGALHLLGRLRHRQGRADLALTLQLHSWRIAPGLGWNAFAAAELLERGGRWGEAAAAYRAAAEALPSETWIRALAGRCEGLGLFGGTRLCEGLSDEAYRIWCRRFEPPLMPAPGPSTAVTANLKEAWILDHGSEALLRPGALEWLSAWLAAHPDSADLLYCDEDRLEAGQRDPEPRDGSRGERPGARGFGRRLDPWFKPGWVCENFWSTPWLGTLALWRRSWLTQQGLPHPPAAGDALGRWRWQLRALACRPRIAHLDRILVHRRQPAAQPPGREPTAFLAHAAALAEHLRHCGEGAVEVTPRSHPAAQPMAPGHAGDPTFRLIWALPAGLRLSVVVLSRDRPDLLERCLHSVERSRRGLELEWLVVDNGSRLEATAALLRHWQQRPGSQVRVLPLDQPFNWSLLNNRAAATATGELLLFLNNDVEVPDRTVDLTTDLTTDLRTNPAAERATDRATDGATDCRTEGWLQAMAGQALRPAIGCVGARLLYPDGTIQHAGVLPALGAGCEHPYRGMRLSHAPHRGRVHQLSGWPALTGACLMLRRTLWWEAGGFDPQLPVEGNDVDFCLRLGRMGLRHVLCPQATLIHHEAASRTAAASTTWRPAQSLLMRRWPAAMASGGPWWPSACSLETVDGRPRELAGRGWI